MKIRLIAAGTRQSAWVDEGFTTYAKRMPRESGFELVEVPIVKRGKSNNSPRVMEDEGKKMLGYVGSGSIVVTLDQNGQLFSSEDLGEQMQRWMMSGQDVALLIGGPDGLSPACHARGDLSWSLSRAVFPHGLVRVMVVEQLYRAWTLVKGHPYHRA